jgi:hypothetical protein
MFYGGSGLAVFGDPGESEPIEGRFKIFEGADRPASERRNQGEGAHTPVRVAGVDQRQPLNVWTTDFAKHANAFGKFLGAEITSNVPQVEHRAFNAALLAGVRKGRENGTASFQIQFPLGAHPDELSGTNELDFERHVFPPSGRSSWSKTVV